MGSTSDNLKMKYLQIRSTGRRLGASTWFRMKVNMSADNAWKLGPLNTRLFLLFSHHHTHQLCYIQLQS